MTTGLQCIAENIYFIPDATNIGVICDKKPSLNGEPCRTDIYLVDGGYSPDRGKMILDILDASFSEINGKKTYTLQAVMCTHTHADHVSGCAYLEAKTGCQIWCTRGERGNFELPLYEQAIFSGGFP